MEKTEPIGWLSRGYLPHFDGSAGSVGYPELSALSADTVRRLCAVAYPALTEIVHFAGSEQADGAQGQILAGRLL